MTTQSTLSYIQAAILWNAFVGADKGMLQLAFGEYVVPYLADVSSREPVYEGHKERIVSFLREMADAIEAGPAIK